MMFDVVKDTIQSQYKVTYDTSYVVIHKEVKQPEPFLYVNHLLEDTSMFIYQNQWGELLYIDQKLTKFEPKAEVEVEPIPVIPFRASDTIQPCDAKWLIKGKKLELKPYSIQKCNNKMVQDYLYSDLSNSIVMMLMLLATSIWLYRSTFYWLEMIRKINKIVKS
jgi:hypothetical protein